MKKVLICLTSLSSGNGIAKAIMNYYNELIKSSYQVDFLLILNLKSNDEYLELIKKSNSKIFTISEGNKIKKSIYIKTELSRILKNEKYDIIHVNLVQLYAYACIHTAKKMKVKNIIYHVHNPTTKLPFLKDVLYKITNYLCIKQATHYFACSNLAGKSVFKNKKFQVIKNLTEIKQYIYDENARKEYRKQFNIQPNELVIGVVARIEEQKNPYFVFHIVSELMKKRKNIKLLWIGTGSLKGKIEEYIQKVNIANQCMLLEIRNDVNKIYSAMDVFFLPSLYEGLGIVFIEAQSAGLPILTSTKVPTDIEVTDLVYKLDLQENIEIWVNQLDNLLQEKIDRPKYGNIMQNSGYDISNDEALVKAYDNIIEEEENK